MIEQQERFDEYNKRSSEAARPAIAATVLLNSGAWIALLSQTGTLLALETPPAVGPAMFCWTFGAALGCLAWLFAFLSAYCNVAGLVQETGHWTIRAVDYFVIAGIATVALSILAFLAGAYLLSSTMA